MSVVVAVMLVVVLAVLIGGAVAVEVAVAVAVTVAVAVVAVVLVVVAVVVVVVLVVVVVVVVVAVVVVVVVVVVVHRSSLFAHRSSPGDGDHILVLFNSGPSFAVLPYTLLWLLLLLLFVITLLAHCQNLARDHGTYTWYRWYWYIQVSIYFGISVTR